MEKNFSPKIGESVHHFNTHPETIGVDRTAIAKINAKAEATKTIMGDNIRMSLQAQESAEELQKTSTLVRQSSMIFKRKTIKMKRTMQYEYCKLNWGITVAVVIFIYVFFAYQCGFTGETCFLKIKQRHNNNDNGGNVNDDSIENDAVYNGNRNYDDDIY